MSTHLDLPNLTLVCLRLTLRGETTMRLPRWKGALLRGGLGHALHATFCPAHQAGQPCAGPPCIYHTLFAPEVSPGTLDLKGVRDAPRPFVMQPPLDERTTFQPGDQLQFGMILIGHATAYVPHIISAFQTFGAMGLGLDHGRATLMRAASYDPIRQTTLPLLEQGLFRNQAQMIALQQLADHALPESLTLQFITPMRIKSHGELASMPDCQVLVRAAGRRIALLAELYGTGPWLVDSAPLMAAARQVRTRECQTTWVDWSRTSGTTGQQMVLGGFVGRATYDHVPPAVGRLLQAGALVHLGKACVFGHGGYRVQAAAPLRPMTRPRAQTTTDHAG